MFTISITTERNNFEGFSKPKKHAQVIRVRRAAAPRGFELELLVIMQSQECANQNLEQNVYVYIMYHMCMIECSLEL